jgi:hypothetical protein
MQTLTRLEPALNAFGRSVRRAAVGWLRRAGAIILGKIATPEFG